MVETNELKVPAALPRPNAKAIGDKPAASDKPELVSDTREQTDESLGVERTAADELLTIEHEAADKALKKLRASADTAIADVRERDEALLAQRPEDPDELARVLKSERRTEDQVRDAERSFLDKERQQASDERTQEENTTSEKRKVTDENLSRERVAEDVVLKLSEEPFRLLVSQVKDFAIFLLDPRGVIISWNEGAERLKGYREDEVLGKRFTMFYTPQDLARGVPDEELRVATREGRIEAEGLRVRKDGSTFMANVLLTALYGPGAVHLGFAKITRDITERFLRAERDLRRTEEALKFANDHVAAVVAIHVNAEKSMSAHQRLVERVTAQIAKPRTAIALISIASLWMLANVVAPRFGRAPWDPMPFFWLQGAVGAYASLVTTIVLATQNRQQAKAEQQAYLELQVNLASEKKTAKVIELLEELRSDMPSVPSRVDHQAAAMACAVDPQAMMSAFKETLHVGAPKP